MPSEVKINQKVLSELVLRRINKIINATLNKIKIQALDFGRDLIRNSNKFQALHTEDIAAEFGTNDIPKAMEDVLKALKDEIHVIKRKLGMAGNIFKGDITFNFIDTTYRKLLDLPSVHYVSEPSNSDIEWLRWILIDGDTTIDNWMIVYGNSKKSRTGLAIMLEYYGRHWLVPYPFQGDSAEDNMLTQALDGYLEQFRRIIMDILIDRIMKTSD